MRHGRGLPGLVRPDHERPPRRHRAAPRASFDRVVVASSANPRKAPLLDVDDAGRGHPRGARREAGARRAGSRSRLRRPDRRLLPRGRAPASSSAACGRSATSRPSCSWPTTTGSSRRDVDTVFFMTSLEHGYVSSSLVKEIAAVRRRRVARWSRRRRATALARGARRGADRPAACHNRATARRDRPRTRRAVRSTSSSSSSGSSR